MKNTITAAGGVLADRERAEDAERHEGMRGDRPVPQRAHDVPEDRIAAGQDRGQGEPRRDPVDERLGEPEPLAGDPDQRHQRDDGHEGPAEQIRQSEADA